MKYLTQILGKRVTTVDGVVFGRVADALAELGGRLPAMSAILVNTRKGEVLVPYDCIEFDPDPAGPKGTGAIAGDIRLRVSPNELPTYTPPESVLYLKHDVLDRQIVDVHDFRVVRVNDVRLAECGLRYCVVGVDASLRAMLRRLEWGVSRPLEWLTRLVGKPLRSNLIGWHDVQTLETGGSGGRIRLKVTHDKIARLHPADIADIVEQLSPQQRTEVIEALDTETAAETIAEAEPEIQVQILQQLDDQMAMDVLTQMEPDDAADLLDDLPEDFSDELLGQMKPQEAEVVNKLMAYDEDTAGGLMTTEFVAVPAEITCEATINRLRELAPKAETIYYVYVVDEEDRLAGVLSLRDLVIAHPTKLVGEIMVRNVIHVYVEDHADEVAQVIGRYNLLAVPVVDPDEALLGIITVDDTMERLLPPERRRRLPVLSRIENDED